MKRIGLFLLFFVAAVRPLRAQQIFDYELGKCNRILCNPRSGILRNRIAFFQKTAMLYLRDRLQETSPTADQYRNLDREVYHMADFLSFYHDLLVDERFSEADHEQLKTIFREASLHHPLFYDANETFTLQFLLYGIRAETPFSLDTDWKKALGEVWQRLASGKFHFLLPAISPPPRPDGRRPGRPSHFGER